MGNFSISHYAGIRLDRGYIEIRYILDEAEIPTFQEIQRTGIVPRQLNSNLSAYLADQADAVKAGLRLELDGQPVTLATISSDVIFPAGAGGLPTMKLGFDYRASLLNFQGLQASERHELRYRDDNFRDRSGWKEIVVTAAPNIGVVNSSVPSTDQSQQLTNYPTDLLNSPPQELEAVVVFSDGASVSTKRTLRPAPPGTRTRESTPGPTVSSTSQARASQPALATRLELKPNQQATPRNAFTELMNMRELSLSIVLLAAVVALGLGGLHALEPGHGKTLVAAYLVGTQGTAVHAFILGVIVTVSHTAGVFLLGAITLYAQKHIVPEQLYPWLGVISGLTISLLGIYLLLQRYLGVEAGQVFAHSHGGYRHRGFVEPGGDLAIASESASVASTLTGRAVSYRQLLALGITGGMVPCPAALVVLLSALALHRVGFGLFLIVAFSVGLAGVLIGTGLVVVYAGRFVSSRIPADGPLLGRWLPMASAAAVTALGLAIALRALLSGSILQIRI
jgi:nickel/cobalt exporter